MNTKLTEWVINKTEGEKVLVDTLNYVSHCLTRSVKQEHFPKEVLFLLGGIGDTVEHH